MESLPLLGEPGVQVTLVAAGLALVLFGRRLFWLLLGLAGALLAIHLGVSQFGLEAAGSGLVIALVVGLAGALLAFFLQGIAVGVGGFLVGVYAAVSLMDLTWTDLALEQILIVAAAGILGGLLGARLFEIALVLISALGGALFVADGLDLQGPIQPAAVGGLFLLGILVQSARPGRKRRKR